MANARIIERLDALETYLSRLPDTGLEHLNALETVALARSEIKDCWFDLANPAIVQAEECPKCGGELKCRECGKII